MINKVKTGEWLSERQTHLRGFNGRSEKLPDVCYLYWVYSSINKIGIHEYIEKIYSRNSFFNYKMMN